MKKLGTLLSMAFSRAMSRSAPKAVEHSTFSSVQPFIAKSRVGVFGITRIHKIMLPPQTWRPMQSGASETTQSMLPSIKLHLVPGMAQFLHVSPNSVKPQYQLAIVHIQWMKQGSLFVFSFIFLLTTSTNSLPSFRAHIARWCAESNWPMNLVKDCEFSHLMKAGCLGTSIPTPATVGRDIKISFEKCRKQIDKILKVSLTFNTMAAILIYFY